MEKEITAELLTDLETALCGLLKQLLPSAAFTIRRQGQSITLTLHSETYPRFVKVGRRDMLPLKRGALLVP